MIFFEKYYLINTPIGFEKVKFFYRFMQTEGGLIGHPLFFACRYSGRL